MRMLRFATGLFILPAVLVFASGCWTGPFPGHEDDRPAAFMCSDEDSDISTDVPPADRRFVGTWNWIESCGGIAGMCSSPESVGYDERLHLSPRGSYTRCREESTIEEGLYLIEHHNVANRVHFVNPDLDTLRTLFIQHVSRDTLLLDEGCCDMFAHLYARD